MFALYHTWSNLVRVKIVWLSFIKLIGKSAPLGRQCLGQVWSRLGWWCKFCLHLWFNEHLNKLIICSECAAALISNSYLWWSCCCTSISSCPSNPASHTRETRVFYTETRIARLCCLMLCNRVDGTHPDTLPNYLRPVPPHLPKTYILLMCFLIWQESQFESFPWAKG